MKKKIGLLVILALSLVCAVFMTACKGGDNSANLKYILNFDENGYVVSAADGAVLRGSVVIPSTHNGLPVTEIANNAFFDNHIDNGGAGTSGIISITIPSSVTVIGNYAFLGTAITGLSIPSSVESVGEGAFIATPLFDNAQNDGVVYADKWAAGYKGSRDSVTNISLRDNTVGIANGAFRNCINLAAVTLSPNLKFIGDSAFIDCSLLTAITLPPPLVKIGWSAFANSGLEQITLPSAVAEIRNRAFMGCDSLAAITVDANNPHFSSQDGILFDKNMETLICYPAGKTGAAYTIPLSVTNIGAFAFSGNSFFSNINFHPQIINIEMSAFSDCTALTTVTLPPITVLEASTFLRCSGLVSITIPASVATIRMSVFSGCISLTDIYFTGTQTQWNAIDKTSAQIPATATVHFI